MEQGIFQADLAKMLGVDEMTIINWEKGRTKLGKKSIEKLKELIQDVMVGSLG